MIVTNIEGLRDPFMLVEDGVYYLYGTGAYRGGWDQTTWDCYVNASGSLHGAWEKTESLVYEKPAYAQNQFWAPEVHKYKGRYYMLATYFSSKTGHRGCSILAAPEPVGPFVEITEGHITPGDGDYIDGTLYVEPQGQPWLVFVREWTCTEDHVGRMVAAKLSDDLSRLISDPVELFRADSPAWTKKVVTDGCFLHTLENGKLIMLWSNFVDDGYTIGIVHSKNGDVTGPWEHEEKPIYKRGTLDGHDGGHGMIFTDTDRTKYICCHSPNNPCEECAERTILIPVREEDGTLRIR